jgi:hypothetical protein
MCRWVYGTVALLLSALSYGQTCTGSLVYFAWPSQGDQRVKYGPIYFGGSGAGHTMEVCQAGVGAVGSQIALQVFGTSNATYNFSNHRASAPVALCAFDVQVTQTNKTTGVVSQSTPVGRSAAVWFVDNQCRPAVPCENTQEENFAVHGSVPAESCNPVTHCKMVRGPGVCMGSSCMFTQTHTTQSCGPSSPDADPPDPGEACASAGTNEFCKSGDDGGQNCGFLNGNFVCLGQTDDDGCQVFGDSSRVCGPKAPMPPVPDNGTPGQRASPDQQIDATNAQGNQVRYNYYNSSTVNNSARDPGTSGDNPYDGEDDGTGAGTGLNSGGNPTHGNGDGGDGDGNGTDDDGCSEEDGCTGTLPSIGEEGDCPSFGACLAGFWTRLGNAPIIAAVADAGASIPAGSCPAVNITMFGETNSISQPMCEVWSGTIAPLIGVVFLAIFAWVSTRIVLSA